MFFLAIIFTIIKINLPYNGKNYINKTSFTGTITDIYRDNEKLIIDITKKDKIRATFYSDKIPKLELGDNVTVYGDFSFPKSSTNPNLFNYQDYLKSKNIYFIMNVTKIKKNISNHNLFFKAKNYIKKYTNENISYKYLNLFILGDNRYIDNSIKNNYQSLGISHLFSVSGMHISILSGIMLKILKKIKIREVFSNLLTCLFIAFYMFLVGFSPSALRSGLFFLFLTINNYFYFFIEPFNLSLLVISLILFFNPYIVYNTGFLYSSIITSSLLLFGNITNNYSNYFIKLLMTSIIAFLFSFPISIYNYYQINYLTIFYNLFFVPLVSIIIFPLSLICIVFKFLSPFLNFLTNIMELVAQKLVLINSNIIFMKPNIIIVLIYYLLIFLIFKYKKKILILFLIMILFCHYNYNLLIPRDYMLMIDVGQGDSILLHSGNKNILVDTGGKFGSEYNLASQVVIPLLKSLGIRQIDYIFLTHGDYDHVGETINLINDFVVKKVYFNEGVLNANEKRIITSLDKMKIPYYISYEGSYYKIGNYHFYSLNRDLLSENDSSLILYGSINNHRFMLMGDASQKSEIELLKKYQIDEVEILKVGHHGSRTSTSKELITKIKPKYALISAGENNKFLHPHQETIDLLEKNNIKYYITSQNGAILINFKKKVTFSTYGT